MPIESSRSIEGLASLNPFAHETPLTAVCVNTIDSKFGADAVAIRRILLGVLTQDSERLSIAAEADIEGVLDLLRAGVNFSDQLLDLLMLSRAACTRLSFAASEKFEREGGPDDWSDLKTKILGWNSEVLK